ncbi:hypothetical protein HanRHA438_Chr10g0471751 [Helianthus annuus]|nr:hypothetical protein HanXRQr2_Chr10g0458891 [Helianthus annuus]KAJ0881201.1 hypothetical protein HanRHA438_Chr10g0471751 [Helianthus annuus]KAJ0885227.1 hypothetical protein HanPSC8_Chr10g0442931 [Helianthus annuus]
MSRNHSRRLNSSLLALMSVLFWLQPLSVSRLLCYTSTYAYKVCNKEKQEYSLAGEDGLYRFRKKIITDESFWLRRMGLNLVSETVRVKGLFVEGPHV